MEIMNRLMMDAPAEVPATTAPRWCARRIASPRGVPTTYWLSLSWLPPVMKTPVAPSTWATRAGSPAAAREAGSTVVTVLTPRRVKTSV